MVSQPEEIETLVSLFFSSIGFRRVSDLVGESPKFKNADFINLELKTIVELTILEKDHFSQGGIIDSFHVILPAPLIIDKNGLGLYNVSLPSKNHNAKPDTFEEPLRKILKKANRQIKETKTALEIENAYGILFIVANGFKSLPISTLSKLVHEILNTDFSSISGHIVYSSQSEVYDQERLEYFPGSYSNITKSCDQRGDEICQYIAESWIMYVNEVLN